jgi:hypothetical protein
MLAVADEDHVTVEVTCLHLQALICVERLISGERQYKEALMSAKVIDSGGTELPALQAILQVRPETAAISLPLRL